VIDTIITGVLDYGVAGIFIAYLIYDRQVILKKVTASIDKNTTATLEMIEYMRNK